MTALRVGSVLARKGIEYAGILLHGNSIKVGTGVKISINRTPFDATDKNEIFLVHPDFTYSLEKDTMVTLYRTVDENLDHVIAKACYATFDLVDSTESGDICLVTIDTDINANMGTFQAVAYVSNNSNKNRDITIDMKYDGTSIKTNVVTVQKKTTKAVSIYGEITAIATTGKDFSFTLTANGDNCSVDGVIHPSVIKIIKKYT